MPKPANTISDILLRLVVQEDGCITWPGGRTSGGYGKGTIRRKTVLVHRVVYQHFRGPVPLCLQLDHLCRNPACANPWHLEAVTAQENILRSEGKAAINARKTHCSHGHPLAGGNLMLGKHGRRGCRECNRRNYLAYRERHRERYLALHRERERARRARLAEARR